MIAADAPVWLIIIALGVGTYLIRLSFVGMIGGAALPEWLLRHLRYTPVAIMPGMVAPSMLTADGSADPLKLAVGIATLGVGMATRNVLAAVAAGVVVYALGLALGAAMVS